MPLYMDVHEHLPDGATKDDVAKAHEADVATQDQYGVKYLKYWVDEEQGKVFCLVDAPDPESAERVHREAHGLVADHIHQVSEGS
jgi:Nickel responsive protein SCO4226-like